MTEDVIEEFRDMCKMAAKKGNNKLLRYVLENVDTIVLSVGGGDRSSSYESHFNLIKLNVHPGNVAGSVGIFLHEATHFVQSVTRTIYDPELIDRCYAKLQGAHNLIQHCISDVTRECPDLLKLAKSSNYLGPGSVAPYGDTEIDERSVISFVRDGSRKPGIEGGAEVSISPVKVGGGSRGEFQLAINEITDPSGVKRVPDSDDRALWNLFSRINAVVDDFGRIMKGYVDLMSLRGGEVPDVIKPMEQEAVLAQTVSPSNTEEFCSDEGLKVKPFDPKSNSGFERNTSPKIVTKEVSSRMSKSGEKTRSTRTIKGYPGRTPKNQGANNLKERKGNVRDEL